jgi:hypothetical protein
MPSYKPEKVEADKIRSIYDKMDACLILRKQPLNYFDGNSLEEYINESVKRWNSFIPPRDDGDWRTSVFMPETRNKITAILSFVASQRMRVEIQARSKDKPVDNELSTIVSALYEHSMDSENGDLQFLRSSLEALVKGTAIVFEGYKFRKRDVKRVDKHDHDTGKSTYKKDTIIDDDRVFQRVVPLEDIFIPNFYTNDIQDQPYIIEREELEFEIAKYRYQKFPNFEFVEKKAHVTDDKDGDLFFYERWNERVEATTVEVLHFWDKWNDEYHIVANGVLLTQADNPFIFDHKKYPYAYTLFEPMAVDFFYGKALPQKIISEQDVVNALYNMMLDRTYLSVMPFFFTSLMDEIDVSSIGPLERIQVSDTTQIREANIRAVSQGENQMLQQVISSMNKSSVDPSQQGQVSGETATAVLQARESSIRLMGLFTNFLAWLTHDQAVLRVANILQFYPKPNALIEGPKEYRVEDQILSDGKKGVKIIRVVENNKEKPDEEDVEAERERSDNPDVEIYYASMDQLRNIDYTLKVLPSSSIPETKALKKALGLEYVNTALQMFPDMVNKESLFEYVNELFDQSDDKMKMAKQEGDGEDDEIIQAMKEQVPSGAQPMMPGEELPEEEMSLERPSSTPVSSQLNNEGAAESMRALLDMPK